MHWLIFNGLISEVGAISQRGGFVYWDRACWQEYIVSVVILTL